MPVPTWLLDRIKRLTDRRQSLRRPAPELVAHYWDGAEPRARVVKDVSVHGAYILTDYFWYEGTVVTMTLQRIVTGNNGNTPHPPDDAISTRSKIVRRGKDGVGVEFMYLDTAERRAMKQFLAGRRPNTNHHPKSRVATQSGQSLIELALMFPLLFLLIVNAVNFGAYIYAWVTISNAVRTIGQYNIMSAAYLSSPTAPTAAQLTALINNEVSSLPNSSSIVVSVCKYKGSSSCVLGSATATADPESTSYVSTSVDVTYTYQPIIPLWNFPRLGVSATIPAATMHRRIVMRIIQ